MFFTTSAGAALILCPKKLDKPSERAKFVTRFPDEYGDAGRGSGTVVLLSDRNGSNLVEQFLKVR